MKFDVFLKGKKVDLARVTKNIILKDRDYIDVKYYVRYMLHLFKKD